MRDIHVCFATNDGYAPYCAVAIQSILINADPQDRLLIYILHGGLVKENVELLERLINNDSESDSFCCGLHKITLTKLDKSDFIDMPLASGKHFSHIETYFRFAIPRIFSQVKRMLYLDCDILIKKSLWPIYDANMAGKAIGMVKCEDFQKQITTKAREFNAGVMLMNCEKWREKAIENQLRRYMEENVSYVRLQDQEVINNVLYDNIFELPERYNMQIKIGHLSNESAEQIIHDNEVTILHYISDAKPWQGVWQSKLTDEYFSYMGKIPFLYQDLRERNKGINGARYYTDLACLRYLLAFHIITQSTNLLLVFEKEIQREFLYAAQDAGFLHVSPILLSKIVKQQVSDRNASTQKNPNIHGFMIIDSYDYNRITQEMRLLGYTYEKDYVLLRSAEQDQIAEELAKQNVSINTKAAIYGTAQWAGKCTEVLHRAGIEVSFYLDSDYRKEGSQIFGKKIIHPDRLVTRYADYDKIIIASFAHREIKNILLNIGVPQEQIISFEAFI